MMLKKSLPVLLLLLIVASCKNEPKIPEETLSFETSKTVKKSGEGCHTNDFNCTVISIEVPVAMGPKEPSEKINRQLQDHVFSLIPSEENSKAPNYEEFAKEFIAAQHRVESSFGSEIPWRAIIFAQVSFRSPQLVSIAIDSEIFTGGAHGYSSLGFRNFRPATGERLDSEALLKKDFLEYAEKAFREKYDIAEGAPINSTGYWFEKEVFHLPQSIGILDDRLVLVYNPYEIASYADGEFRLEFPLEEVKNYLKIDPSEEALSE